MFAGEYFAAYPDAGFYAAPGLPEKRTDLPFDGVLGDEPEPGWAIDLEQAVFRGNRMVREVAFCHQESRTLILADLVQSAADSGSPPLTRLVKRLMGTHERPGMPLPFRLGFRDKAAARASVERILSWDFDRILLCHGPIVESGGKALFREASFASLCGVATIEVSSGKVVRHRLNRGGNREANRALYMVCLSRMRRDRRTQEYVARRTAEGKSKREIIRCLKL